MTWKFETNQSLFSSSICPSHSWDTVDFKEHFLVLADLETTSTNTITNSSTGSLLSPADRQDALKSAITTKGGGPIQDSLLVSSRSSHAPFVLFHLTQLDNDVATCYLTPTGLTAHYMGRLAWCYVCWHFPSANTKSSFDWRVQCHATLQGGTCSNWGAEYECHH